MRDIPQIVRERLRVATSPVGHPDADVLTAFAERSLPEAERAVVMEHLARCGDCREVVALALPISEGAAVPDAIRVGSGWLTWPALRWGVVAAGIIAVASVGVRTLAHRPQTTAVATRAFQRNEAAEKIAPTAPHADTVTSPSSSQSSAQAASSIVAENKSNAPAAARSVGSVPRVAMPQRRADSPSSQAGASANAAGAGAQPQALDSLAQNPASPTTNYSYDAPQPKPSADSDTFARAKAPVAAQSAAAVIAPPITSLQTSPSLLQKFKAPIPRWTITASGGLQRSFDGGSTWQDVNVNANPLSARSSPQVEVDAANAKAAMKRMDASGLSSIMKDKDKQANSAPASPLFRSVTALGLEVWAGGTAGMLYHSSDGGEHWLRIVPSSAGVALTGDIAGVEFSDALHGDVVTSTSEVWITADAGASWQKQ